MTTTTTTNNNDDMTSQFGNVDVEGIKFGEPTKLSTGGVMIYTNNSTGYGNPTWQSPEKMLVKFPISLPQTEGQGHKKVTIELAEGPYLEWLKSLDERIVEALTQNSEKWFKKPLSKEVVADKYSPIAKQSDPKYPYLMKFRVPEKHDGDSDKKQATKVFLVNSSVTECEDSTVDCVEQYGLVTARLKLIGLYFVGSQVYPLINAEEMLVYPPEDGRGTKRMTEGCSLSLSEPMTYKKPKMETAAVETM